MKLSLSLFATGLIIFLSANFSYAQSNQKKTTITFADGTKKEGLVEYRNWDVAPKSILFREDGSTRTERISSDDINTFYVKDGNTDVLFEKHKVQVEITHMNNVEYFDVQVPEYAIQSILLRSLVKGNVSLYVTFLNNKNVYYVAKNGETPYELVNRSFINKSRIVITDDKFRSQLKNLGCANERDIDRTSYSRNELSAIIKKCNNEKGDFAERSSSVKNRFGLVAGVDLASSLFKESSPFGNDFSTRIKLPAEPGLHIGAFADISLSKQTRQWSLYVEAAYSQVKNSGRATFSDTKDYDFKVDLSYIKISPLFRYYFPSKLFVNAGPAVGAMINDNQTKTNGEGQVSAIYDDVRKLSIGAAGGLGYLFKNFSIEARYELNNGYSTYNGRSNNFNIITGVLSYSF